MITRVRTDIKGAYDGWTNDWERMTAQLIVSFIVGQGLFWRWGYDQLSVGGSDNRIMQAGLGQRVSEHIYTRVPHTTKALYTTKALEVLADLGKCGVEGATYKRYGITPDIVACGVTQPLWSVIEALEKIASMASKHDAYAAYDEEEFRVAIACIYGSVFRYGIGILILALGGRINRYLTEPLTRGIRRSGPVVPVAVAAFIAFKTKATINLLPAQPECSRCRITRWVGCGNTATPHHGPSRGRFFYSGTEY